jgi:putative hemolysin
MATAATTGELFSITALASGPATRWLLGLLSRPLESALQLGRLRQLYAAADGTDNPFAFADAVLENLEIRVDVSTADLCRIPETGPVAVVANHPYGLLDGLLLIHLLGQRRRDLRVLANGMLNCVPELTELFFEVDPWRQRESHWGNHRAARGALKWWRDGGAVLLFPAGAISGPTMQRAVVDAPWLPQVGRMLQRADVPVVPAFIGGHNSGMFQAVSLVNASLRLALLPRELLRQRGKTVGVTLGGAVSGERLNQCCDPEDAAAYLRFRTYLLSNRGAGNALAPSPSAPASAPPACQRPMTSDGARMRAEIQLLAPEQRLASSRGRELYVAGGRQIPGVLEEIGRLRELSFREVGEGTGEQSDLDRFDEWYQHLFVWDAEAGGVVGAYRAAHARSVIDERGTDGLYTTTLFDMPTGVIDGLADGIELGRSFISPQYQRQHAALALLWQGIGQLVLRVPRCHQLFGAVSISSDYLPAARELLADVLMRQYAASGAEGVRPRCPWQRVKLERVTRHMIERWGSDLAEVEQWLADIDDTHPRVPVLVRQYERLGAEVLGLNLDPAFSNALDALIIVNLANTPDRQLTRFMGDDAPAEMRRRRDASA